MPPQPDRIAEDLRGLIVGEVLSDELTRLLYATDASQYEIVPAVVLRPRVTADVAATVRYAHQEGLTVHARGGGSGLAGGCLGPGIVIDFSRYMRRVLSDDGDQVVVQPGLVHAELNRRLLASGRQFAPDPPTSEVTTLGGMAAVDASGSRRPVYGSMRDHVLGMKVVLADGTVARLGSDVSGNEQVVSERIPMLASQVGELAELRRDVIREQMPNGCANVSGYALDHLLGDEGGAAPPQADLLQLLVGSEGTLGLVTELTLRTVPLPAVTRTLLLTFTSLERAAQAVQELVPLGVAACDLLDRRHIGLARELDPRYELLLSGAAEALLCVELIGPDEEALAQQVTWVVQAVREPGLAAEVLVAETDEDRLLHRDLRMRYVATLHGLKGNRRAATGVEAIALPPPALPQFFGRLQEILKRRQVTASVFGHVAHGQLHIRPLLDLASPADLRKLEALASDLYDTVWLLGGTMSGAHGDGLSRTPFTSRQHGPLVNVFREVKRLFDPQGVLNPGKVVPAPGGRMTHHPRAQSPSTHGPPREGAGPVAEPAPSDAQPLVELQLNWTPEEATLATRSCNGCGACRSIEPGGRMCPVFRFSPTEEASPRAKANLMRGVLSGRLSAETLLRDETKRVADLCVNCHMCRIDCPAEVDIPKLMLEAKGVYVKTNGLPPAGVMSMRLDAIAGWLSRMPRLTNHLLTRRWFRWLLERGVGLASSRKLPPFADRPYLKQAAARRLHIPPAVSPDGSDRGLPSNGPQPNKRVLYFVDTYANYFDVELAVAFEQVIRRHGIGFYAPSEQLHSGMAMISQGGLDTARGVAERNVSLLAEAIRQGYSVVATDPSAVLALTHEYLHLMPSDEDARLVAENTHEACHYLWRHHLDAKLQLDMGPLPLRVAYHVPCHIRALGVGTPAENLMRLIPELRTVRLDRGCSGMAGTFGLSRKNYRSSLRAGLPMLSTLRGGDFHLGTTECGACRTQMEQSAPIDTMHPIKLLAASYGVMPELREHLRTLEGESAIP